MKTLKKLPPIHPGNQTLSSAVQELEVFIGQAKLLATGNADAGYWDYDDVDESDSE